jgi:hypothetical protein
MRWLAPPYDSTLVAGGRPARRFPFQHRRVARFFAGVGVQAHLLFSKGGGRLGVIFTTPLQNAAAEQRKFLRRDAILPYQSQIGPHRIQRFGSIVRRRAFEGEHAEACFLREPLENKLHLMFLPPIVFFRFRARQPQVLRVVQFVLVLSNAYAQW